ncbi:Filamentation induced by cAMP protein Fic [Candidatus Desulfarcum epimagneticum]|uniref:Filamentation induced by cAMP protein Fic n=1 Tax=uncultured Desulfobacteraceae bacterium TaxID=218296 RepID=A0A484HBW5_9BACT|nr:Filamentation induced by cAMP protein Fic [uncultured Desulfobacteraceae bacterium]
MTHYARLDQLKQKLDSFRPLPPETVAGLHEDIALRWTYHSNAIEGNTLTLKETKVVLEGVTIGGKTMREHFEVINHRQAIGFVEEIAKKEEPLSEWRIKSIHQLVLKNIDDPNAGVWRRCNVVISGADHTPPDFTQVPSEMERLIEWHGREGQKRHPVERAARLHADFVKIHPFVDGNGRTARLLMNFDLMKDGFPPAVLGVEKRLEYYESLDTAHTTGDYGPFLSLMAGVVEDGFKPYRRVLGIDI